MKAANYQIKSPSVNDLLFGTKNSSGDTVNFRVQDVVNLTQAPEIVSTATLASYTISNINTYFTGTPAAIAFAAVVILTMFAAKNFDPRLLWDNQQNL